MQFNRTWESSYKNTRRKHKHRCLACARVCVICGARLHKNGESTIGFRSALKAIGIDGDKAHPSCLKDAQQKYEARRIAIKP